jgi:hypothetical protein
LSDRPRDAARAHEDAQDAVAAARAARDRAAQIALEAALRRERAGHEPLHVDSATEAVLRAHLEEPPEDPASDSPAPR